VVAVAKDSPAERAGIKAGDELLAVDGEAVRPGELNEAARKLEGPPGTWVRLMIQRDGTPREFRIKRVRLL
jgi:carboxyl-terminal processing protease